MKNSETYEDRLRDKNVRSTNNDPEEENFIYVTIPPDKGFAWVVLLISFTCIALIDGMVMTVGLLFDKAVKDAHVTQYEATVCSAFQSAVYYFSAPPICAIANSYGLRMPAVVGGFTASLGLFLASLSDGFIEMFITYGLIVGLGFGLIFSPTILIVPTYFDKYRAMASAISLAGSGVGTLFVSLLDEYVLYYTHWRTIMFGQSGICLLLAFLTMLYRPVKPTKIAHILGNPGDAIRFTNFDRKAVSEILRYSSSSYHFLSKYKRTENMFKNFFGLFKKKQPDSYLADTNKSYVIKNRPLYQNVFSEAFLRKDKKNEEFKGDDIKSMINSRISHFHLSKRKSSESLKKHSKCVNCLLSTFNISPMIMEGLNLLFEANIFYYRSFRIFLFATFLLSVGIKITYLYITERAMAYNIPLTHTWWLLPSIGIANIVFRVIPGVTHYFYKFDPVRLTGVGLLVSGLFNIASGFGGQDNEIFTILLAVAHGGGTSLFIALRGASVTTYFTLENLRSSFGYHMVATGMGQLLGQLTSGMLVNVSKGYDISFIYGGTCILVSSILFLILPYANTRDKLRIK